MSSIFGLCDTHGRPVSSEALAAMRTALNHWEADEASVWQEGQVGLGHLMLHDTPESLGEVQPLHDAASGVTLTADARIDNREALIRTLGLNGAGVSGLPDSHLILRAYLHWGSACVEHLLGDFAFVVWDAPRRTVFCARDHMGIRPFYYAHQDGLFVFSTEIKGILAVPEVERSLDETWILDALLHIRPDYTGTLYRQIRRLEPAHTLTVTPDGVEIRRYWRLDPTQELRLPSEADYVEAFREKLVEAVRVRTRTAFPIGAELSGGLDSSGVAAIAHRLLKPEARTLTTFSDVLPPGAEGLSPQMKDERPFIDALNTYAGIKDACFVTGEASLLDTVDWAAGLYEQPPKKLLSLYLAPLFAAVQERGVRTLLSGFGGDDMASYAGNGYLEDLMRRGAWRRVWRAARKARSAGWRTVPYLAGVALQEYLPALSTSILSRWNGQRARRSAGVKRFERHAFRPEAVDVEALERRYLQERFFRFAGTMNERLVERLDHPHLLIHRLENAALSASSFRIGYRYPLLDVPLMECYLSMPTEMKHSGRWGRYVYRMSLEGLVPETIRWRRDKSGSSCPSLIYRLYRDAERLLEAAAHECSEAGIGRYVDLDHFLTQQKAVIQEQRLNDLVAFKMLLFDRIVRRAQSAQPASAPPSPTRTSAGIDA